MTSDVEPRQTADLVAPTRTVAPRRVAPPAQRWSRRRGVVGTFAAFAVAAFAAAYVGPLVSTAPSAQAAEIDPVSLYATTIEDAQALSTQSGDGASLGREDILYTVYVKPKPKPTPTATATTGSSASSRSSWSPPFVSPNPGSAQAIAYTMVKDRGWGDSEFACLVALWKKESGWRVNAYNKGSGAYGIPQALPGRKMASAGGDWETNPATQIKWGLGYIKGRYSTPCGAWGHSQSSGWY